MCLDGDIYVCSDRVADADAIGYRNKLYNLLNGSGYYLDFVGSQKYGYSVMSDFDNAGFSGIKDQGLADIIQSGSTTGTWGQITPGPYLNYFDTDIVLLHIGTNDVLADEYNDVSAVGRLLDAIDDYEVANGKPILVFLAKILNPQNTTCGSDWKTNTYNSKLQSMAQSRISSGDHIVIVDMNCGAGLNYYTDMVDQAHPNQTGYDKMADQWFAAIDGYNTAPVVSQIPNQTIASGGSFTQINLDSYVSDVEDNDQEITWSTSPSNPVHFTVSIDEDRKASVTPKDSEWSGSEEIIFIATDRGRVVSGLQKSDNSLTRFSVNWLPEITGQEDITISEGNSHLITLDDLQITDPENAPSGLYVVANTGSNYTLSGTTITPQDGFFGQLSVPVKIVDAGTESNTYPLLMDVVQTQHPPVITSTPILDAYTNGLYEYAVTATDPDPDDVLIFTASEKPSWMQINGSTGLLSGIPSRGQQGVYEISVEVSDGNHSDDQTFSVEVFLQNQPPVITTSPELTGTAGQTYSYGILATDADGDPITYFESVVPQWLEFITAAQVMIGVPSNGDSGENLVILGVTDQIDTSYQSFIIDVSFVAGVGEHEIDGISMIYPNPVNDRVVIDLSQLNSPNETASIELYDMTGKKVLERKLDGVLTEISLRSHGLSTGIYMYQLNVPSERDKIITGKLVIR